MSNEDEFLPIQNMLEGAVQRYIYLLICFCCKIWNELTTSTWCSFYWTVALTWTKGIHFITSAVHLTLSATLRFCSQIILKQRRTLKFSSMFIMRLGGQFVLGSLSRARDLRSCKYAEGDTDHVTALLQRFKTLYFLEVSSKSFIVPVSHSKQGFKCHSAA